MKITDVKVRVVKYENRVVEIGEVPDKRRGTRFVHRMSDERRKCYLPIITISTDVGTTGVSSGSWWVGEIEHIRILLLSYKSLLLGEDPFNRERLWRKLWKSNRLNSTPKTLLGPMDVAIWDLIGQHLQQPVYKLLGGYRNKVLAYANSGLCSSPEDYESDFIKRQEQGYRAYKLTVLTGPDQAIQICRAIRNMAGIDFDLMFDAVESLNYLEALRVGEVLEELDYRWFEEPIQDYEINNLVRLGQKLSIPLCGNENLEGGHYLSAELIIRGALDIIRSDTRLKGGITGVMKTANLCDSFGINCEIHTSHNPILDFANLHVVCSIHNCDYYEAWGGDWSDFGVVNPIKIDTDGYVHVPETPGLGIQLDWDQIENNTVQVL